MEASRRGKHFKRVSDAFRGISQAHCCRISQAQNQRRRPTSGSINFAKKCILIHSLLPAFGLSTLSHSLSLSESVLLTLSLLYAHTIMITIFPSLQSLLFVCVECSQQQQQQITFINWFLATKSVCVCASQSFAAAFQAQGVRLKADGDRETAHFLRTFYVHIYICIQTYMCVVWSPQLQHFSLSSFLSLYISSPLFLFLSLSNGFSNAYSAQSWEYKCLLIVQQVLLRSEGVTAHQKERNYIVE